MDDTIDYLAANNVRLLKKGETVESVRNETSVGATVGMIWLDIEGTDVSAILDRKHICFLFVESVI